MNALMPTTWIMKTADGFYLIQPSEQCKPEDHGRLNSHIISIENAAGETIWRRENGDVKS